MSALAISNAPLYPYERASAGTNTGPQPSSNKFKLLTCSALEHVWSYIGKIAILARNVLNAAAKHVSQMGQGFVQNVKNLTVQMKLLSIVSIPFSLYSLITTAQKIFRSFLINDKEGIALGTLTFSILAADLFDSVTTFVNSVLAVASIPFQVLASASLPVAFAMSGLGTISRSIQIAKTYSLYQNIKEEILSNEAYKNKVLLKKFIETKLGLDPDISSEKTLEDLEALKEKKKMDLLKAAPPEAVKELECLLALLDQDAEMPLTDQKIDEISKGLERVQSLLRKKMTLDVLGIIANLVIISALILFTVSAPGALPFWLMAMGFLIRVSALAYQDLTH